MSNVSAEEYNPFYHSLELVDIVNDSLPELCAQLETMGLSPVHFKFKAIWDAFVQPSINKKMLVVLTDKGHKPEIVGYEFLTLSPYDATKVIAAFTYVDRQYRGQKLSHLLRSKMLELARNAGIKSIYFSVANDNVESLGNLEHFKKKFNIEEVSRTYRVTL